TIGDVMIGDGHVFDGANIPVEILRALSELKGIDADTVAEVKTLLISKVAEGDSETLGLMNFIQGRIGEHQFIEATNGSAMLAPTTNQEGWDVFINHGDSTQ